MNFSSNFLYSAFEKLPFKRSILQIARKNHHYISKSQKRVLKPVHKSKEKELLHISLMDFLKKCKTVEEQIKVFHSVVKLPEENIKCRYSICRDLERVLQPYFPSCSVRLVGSSVTGLGFKGCDVDLSIQFSNEKNLIENIHINEESDIRNPERKGHSPKNLLLTIRKILQSSQYDEPLTVIPGRCPILNFIVHGLPCDLAVNNSLAFHSTNLMLLCRKLDERVAPLMQIISYWAKHARLVGGPIKFKTYAIFLMVVYFLQTRNPPVLPSVEIMFERTDFLKNLENWSYNIEEHLDKFEKSKNMQSIEELLRDFFFFYRSFDYSQIICPINSSSMDKKSFAEKIDNSNIFELNTICIQDPFDRTWNVTTGVIWKHCKFFQKAIISVAEKYRDENSWVPGAYSWGLAGLFDIDAQGFLIDFPVQRLDDCTQRNDVNLLKNAASKVIYILKYCLQVQCHSMDENMNIHSLEIPPSVKVTIAKLSQKRNNDPSSKERLVSTADNSNNNEATYLVSQFLCAAKDTWSNRNAYFSLLDPTKNSFDNEHEISKKILLEKSTNEKEVFYILCECYGLHIEDSLCLRVKMKPLNKEKLSPKLASLLKEYISKFMADLNESQRSIN